MANKLPQNNESSWDWLPRIDPQLCTGCRACVDICPTHALAQVNQKATLAYPALCTYCTACEDICPTHAIALPFLICFETQPTLPLKSIGDETP